MTSNDEAARIRELAKTGRLSSLTDTELDWVLDAARYVTVPGGWALMMEDQPADKAYLILSGSVSVRRDGAEIATVGEGEVIGEMALVNQRLRNATAIANGDLEVLHFTAESVAELVGKIPHFREALLGAAAERSDG